MKTFAEKPNAATAQQFIESGDFLWNSGTVHLARRRNLTEIRHLLPELHEELAKINDVIGTEKI